jgi:hypothetical protein
MTGLADEAHTFMALSRSFGFFEAVFQLAVYDQRVALFKRLLVLLETSVVIPKPIGCVSLLGPFVWQVAPQAERLFMKDTREIVPICAIGLIP